jgi:hypothetical protein
MKHALHFVGFRGNEFTTACLVWGRPDFIHRGWDLRARREIAPGDTIVFAKGDAEQTPRPMSFNDLDEEYLL